jgi:hypothetical protein
MIDRPSTKEKRNAFKREILRVCAEHGLSISHEDTHGAFLIEAYNEVLTSWFAEASYEDLLQPEPDTGIPCSTKAS